MIYNKYLCLPNTHPLAAKVTGMGGLPCRAQQLSLQKRRKCACLVAESVADKTLVGCAFTSLVAPEALLPPPWPTTKPLRFYMSNLGVLQSHRRRGVALALLKACETLGETLEPATTFKTCSLAIKIACMRSCLPCHGSLVRDL